MAANIDNAAKLSRLLRGIEDSIQRSALFQDIDNLCDAAQHVVEVLRPPTDFLRRGSADLLNSVRLYKQYIDQAIEQYKRSHTVVAHYNAFILDIAYHIDYKATDEELVATFLTHLKKIQVRYNDFYESFIAMNEIVLLIQEAISQGKKRKKKLSMAKRNEQLRELARKYGIPSVGHSGSTPQQSYCFDVHTHKKLDPSKMLIKDLDQQTAEWSTTGTPDVTASTQGAMPVTEGILDPSVPLPAADNPFGEGFVPSNSIKERSDFKILSYGTVYGFAVAPDGTYAMVFAVQFSHTGSFNEAEQQAIDAFAEFVPKAAKHAYHVTVNSAQNAESERQGHLWSCGWRPGRMDGERIAVYTAQSTRDKHNPDGYIDLYESLEVINAAWILMQEKLSPRAVLKTIETLADTAVLLFGSNASDIVTHGPSIGSNMAVSKHDRKGRGFANGMHIDRDIDSQPRYYGKVFTFGQWLHLDEQGKLVDTTKIKEAIPDGYFILPGYRIAIDLGAAAVVTGIWRGGMDLHGTTTSNVNPAYGITRWGMSIQTNRNLSTRLRSNKGHIFGLYDRLQEYYELFAEDCVEE